MLEKDGVAKADVLLLAVCMDVAGWLDSLSELLEELEDLELCSTLNEM